MIGKNNSGGSAHKELNWIQSNRTSSTYSTIYYANGVWIASGSGIDAYYSTDGKNWTLTTANITEDYNPRLISICYANGIWVAKGTSDNTVLRGYWYSTDGKTWTQSKRASYANRYPLFYGNGLWLSSASSLEYSTDGKNWTQNTNLTNFSLYSACYANNLWVMCGSYSSTGRTYYSTDGITWTVSNGGSLRSICYANNLWVGGAEEKGIYYSTDGKNWVQSNITSGGFYTVYYNNGLWMACGADTSTTVDTTTTTGIYYSTDGKNWIQSNMVNIVCSSIAYGNNLWIAACPNNGLYYSTDGKTWIQSLIPKDNSAFCSVCYSNGIFVAGGYPKTVGSKYVSPGLYYALN